MRVNRIIEKTYAEGPGTRMCIYVQGCSHACKGCFAEKLWDYSGGYEISEGEITEKLKALSAELDGVTFLGGEPFDKAQPLGVIAAEAQKLGLNVITFTGYTYEELLGADREDYNSLISNTDLLIDGEFKEELLDYSRPMAGSSNQRFIYLSDKISSAEIDSYKNRFEVRTDKNGNIQINGMGNIKKIQQYIKDIGGENGTD